MVPNGYRMISFIAIVEIGWTIVEEYLSRFVNFPPDGQCSMEFVDRVQVLFEDVYHDQRSHGSSYFISKDMVERGINVMAGNIEQYKILMYIPSHEAGLRTYHLLEQLQLPPGRKIRNIEDQRRDQMLVIERILLFDSLLFTATTLHMDSFVRHHSSHVASALNDLTSRKLLIKIKVGIRCARKTIPVYVKYLPDVESALSVAQFEEQLAKLDNNRINFKSIEDRCKRVVLKAKGLISESVFEYIHSNNYKKLGLDTSCMNHITLDQGSEPQHMHVHIQY